MIDRVQSKVGQRPPDSISAIISAGKPGFVRRWCGRLLRCGAIGLLGLGVTPSAVPAETKAAAIPAARAVTEYEVKAVYLVRFLDYVVWPESAFADAGAPIVIGVLGHNPFGKNLDGAGQNRAEQKRPILIRYGRTPEEIGHCHLLFVPATEADHYAEIAKFYATQSVLLVADSPGGLKAGLALEFRRQESTVRFAVNLPNARSRKLELSARLLSSAIEVVQEPVPHAQLNPARTLYSFSQ
jgi:hypothetical protein